LTGEQNRASRNEAISEQQVELFNPCPDPWDAEGFDLRERDGLCAAARNDGRLFSERIPTAAIGTGDLEAREEGVAGRASVRHSGITSSRSPPKQEGMWTSPCPLLRKGGGMVLVETLDYECDLGFVVVGDLTDIDKHAIHRRAHLGLCLGCVCLRSELSIGKSQSSNLERDLR